MGTEGIRMDWVLGLQQPGPAPPPAPWLPAFPQKDTFHSVWGNPKMHVCMCDSVVALSLHVTLPLERQGTGLPKRTGVLLGLAGVMPTVGSKFLVFQVSPALAYCSLTLLPAAELSLGNGPG